MYRAAAHRPAPYRFGKFSLCPTRQELVREATPVELGARAVSLLLFLVERAGQVVHKEALFEHVWGGRIVEDNNLTVQMSALRRVLADGEPGVTFIRTVPGRGYVFIGQVERGDTAPVVATIAARLAPPTRTSFVGRDAEQSELARLAKEHRLVTIAGLGGIGKTRLLEEVAPRLADHYPDGLIRVDLAPVAEALDLDEAIATAAGAGAAPRSARAALLAALTARRALLVLDNAEHLLDAVVGVVQAILETCSGMSVLITSRGRLGLPDEVVLRLQPLGMPPPGADRPAALACDSVRLFVDRAQAVVPGFAYDETTWRTVIQICGRLDGIALAIEMVVPRLQILTVQQIAQRLDERFQLLGTARPGALPRQRTLRAMFDWSWELLPPDERQLLGILAMFSGSAALCGVTALAAGGGISEWDALDALAGLVDNSLVCVETTGATPRYRLLETTRHYALARLSPSELRDLRTDHAAYFAAYFEEAQAVWPTQHCGDWIERYGADADNLRAALAWSFGPEGSAALGMRLAAGSYGLWWDLPGLPLREGHRWLDKACREIDAATPPAIEARLRLGHSWRDVSIGDLENFEAADRSAMLFRQTGDAMGLGAALWRAGSSILTHEGIETARTIFAEAERLLRAEPPSRWLGLCLVRRGDVLTQLDRPDAALEAYREALDLVRRSGCWYGLAIGGANLSELLYGLGRRREALAVLAELHTELAPGRRCLVAGALAAHRALAGHDEAAAETVREVIASAAATGLNSTLATALKALSLLQAEGGNVRAAARLDGFAHAIHPPGETARSWRAMVARIDTALSRAIGPAEHQALRSEGAGWRDAQALGEAERLCIAVREADALHGRRAAEF